MTDSGNLAGLGGGGPISIPMPHAAGPSGGAARTPDTSFPIPPPPGEPTPAGWTLTTQSAIDNNPSSPFYNYKFEQDIYTKTDGYYTYTATYLRHSTAAGATSMGPWTAPAEDSTVTSVPKSVGAMQKAFPNEYHSLMFQIAQGIFWDMWHSGDKYAKQFGKNDEDSQS